ncbi:unnamed protein product [Rotaria sordida]|uniref:Uncharacterized protein n=1 Tax=Rotaria sordida TaxID=392033 RepID=A0A815IAR5_9BILA|nr:unnamed protein product [Rotaria sordida]
MGFLYYPVLTNISLRQSSEIHISLSAPPHRINETDTLTIQWKSTQSINCVTWIPTELTFNTKNLQEQQILTLTHVQDGSQVTLIPNFYGRDYFGLSQI